jgi:predicted nucleic acid-binding protein
MGRLVPPASGDVYVDANCIIYSVEKVTPYAERLRPIWEAAAAGSIRIVSSEVTLLETLVRPLKEGNHRLEQFLLAFLQGSNEVRLVPVDARILLRAALVRAETGLKTPDAIHAATALASECAMFLTNDPGFRRVHDLPVVILGEVP